MEKGFVKYCNGGYLLCLSEPPRGYEFDDDIHDNWYANDVIGEFNTWNEANCALKRLISQK